MLRHLVEVLWSVEVGTNERWCEVRGAGNRYEVYLRVVGDLIPIDKPTAAGKKRLEAAHARKDGVAFVAHALLEGGVICVAHRLLALCEEAAVLSAEVNAACGDTPLIRARVEDAYAAARHHKIELIVVDCTHTQSERGSKKTG